MKETLFQRLLNYYQIDESTYLEMNKEVTIDNFAMGHSFKDMDKAVALVKDAIANKDKIFIYGDYDADGIMSTSIIVKSLLKLGVIPEFYIPNRYNDGYGLTMKKSEEVVSKGVKLVITVDNGVSAFEPIAYLKEQGVKVLVLDHHTIQGEVPNADAIIHPTYSGFGEITSSAGFVSFMFSWALLGYFDMYLSFLGAISVISDMMPLRDYNRSFFRLAIKNYKTNKYPNIELLSEGNPFDENTIGMKIAPKINALGRLLDDESINYIVHYFVTEDKNKMNRLYGWIDKVNEERKIVSKEAEESLKDFHSDKEAIVLYKDVKEGMIGLLANHLCSKEHKPTIIFTEEKGGEILKGSSRAPEGFNVVDAFNACGDLLITAGGHALAGGCSIYKKDLDEFERRFVEYTKNNPIQEFNEETVELGLTEITEENYALIQTFSPFGEGMKAPLFMVRHLKTDSLMFSKSGEHLLTYVGQGVKITGFGISRNSVVEYNYVDLIGKLRENTYRGTTSIELLIKDVKNSK